MGLLSIGDPLDWEDSKQHHQLVKHHGIEQFIHLYRRYVGKTGAILRWGDEVEYFVCELDDKSKTAKLPLRAPEILNDLKEFRESLSTGSANECIKCARGIIWHPEYANWMLEATPGQPYGDRPENLLDVEANMILRRKCIQRFLKPGEHLFTMTTFPRVGTPGFTIPWFEPTPFADGGISLSSYIPDQAINPHPRFPTLTANIRKRRGERIDIAIPAHPDAADAVARQREVAAAADAAAAARLGGASLMPTEPAVARAAEMGAIHMDCMAFGMGAGCLQMTFQATDVDEARFLYDQLAIVAPLMLALTAASPIWKGMLADTDVRWDVISASVDDRDAEERGLVRGERGPIPKSRYSSIDCFISRCARMRDRYNDVPCVTDAAALARLAEAGIDDRLANHVAHLFIRDPLVVFGDRLDQEDEKEADHFESLQSTNWNTVRFKPPPADPQSDIKWRVEFRSMELSLTDFENAAHAVFVLLLSRAISRLGINLYMPMSLVDDNMARAHRRNAPAASFFWIRRNVFDGCPDGAAASAAAAVGEEGVGGEDDSVVEMSLGEVFGGLSSGGDKSGAEDNGGDQGRREFPGLCGLVRTYLDLEECDGPVRQRLERYLELMERRARGELLTTAEWIRRLVLNHPEYCGDGLVSEAICYDVMTACGEVSRGERAAPELMGDAGTMVKEDERIGAGVLASLVRSPCACD